MNATKIEWTDMTVNPVVGCSHGCPYCYARKMAKRRKERPDKETQKYIDSACLCKNSLFYEGD